MPEPESYRQFAHFIGVDPGPMPGIVHLWPHGGGRRTLQIDVVQCNAYAAPSILWAFLDQMRTALGQAPALVQIETFVVGRASMKSAAAGAQTRDLIGKLERECEQQPSVKVVKRSASQVKPWATDARLKAAGLLDATKGMRHARDAARHALFAAVHDGGVPDPLSRAHSTAQTQPARSN